MSRAGTRVRRIAARLCDARTMERVVDPTLGDLQAEYEDAADRGRTWQGRWILVRGYVALLQAVIVEEARRGMWALRNIPGDDRRALGRTFRASVALTIAGTLVLAAAPLLRFVPLHDPAAPRLALYLIPQALPLSIPAGLTVGILWGLGYAAASRRPRTVVILLGTFASIASFVMLAWIAPSANQEFRVSMFWRTAPENVRLGQPLQKGVNELTLGELRPLIEAGARDGLAAGPANPRTLALNYHGRWAMAATPLVLAFFSLAVSSRRRWGRTMRAAAGCVALVGYYTITYLARGAGAELGLSAFAVTWMPNIAFVILAIAFMRLASPLDRRQVPA